MNRAREIEEYIAQGYVLDDHGNWVPLSQRANKERDFLKHLMVGEVLDGNTWTSIAQARDQQKSNPTPPPETPYNTDQPVAQNQVPGFAPETVYAEIADDGDDAVDIGLPVEGEEAHDEVTDETVTFGTAVAEPQPAAANIYRENSRIAVPETSAESLQPKKSRQTASALSPEFTALPEPEPDEHEWERSHRRRQRLVLFLGVGLAALGGAAAALLTFLL